MLKPKFTNSTKYDERSSIIFPKASYFLLHSSFVSNDSGTVM